MTRKIELPKDPFELTITGLSSHAEGIGRYDGIVIFVEGALPEEKCKVRVIHRARRMARAVVTEIITPSPYRIDPPCPYYVDCGGCQFQHYTYEKQLEYKRQTIQDALHHIGHLSIDINPVIGEHPYFYRNKMTFPFTVYKDKIAVGLHRRNSYKDIIMLDSCLLVEKPLQELLTHAMNSLNQVFKPEDVYRFENMTGNLRFLAIRSFAGKLVLLLVVREFQKEKMDQWIKLCCQPPLCSSINIYGSADVNEYDWGQNPPVAAWGQTDFDIPFDGITGQAQPLTFLQTNTNMADKLYDYVLHLPVLEKDVLIDGYCGIGLTSLVLASQYNLIFGMDTDANAIASANLSAKKHNFANLDFIPAPVEHALRIFANPLVNKPKQLKPEVEPYSDKLLTRLGNHKITTVILDPPRAGCHPKVIKRLGEIKPKDILMVSCHPAALARDLSGLVSLGYKILSIQPFDLFPQTFHVETVAHLRLT